MQEQREIRLRFRRIKLLAVAFGLILAARIVSIQVFEHEKYKQIGDGQWERPVSLDAERGNLYDRHGRPLALSVMTYQVGISKAIMDPGKLAAISDSLATVLGIRAADIRKKVRCAPRSHVVLATQVLLTGAQKNTLRKYISDGVTMDPICSRVYPLDGVGASLIGFFRPGPKDSTATGLELMLGSYLDGKPGKAKEIRSANPKEKLGRVTLQEPRHGQSLELTIDAELQMICERRLARSVKKTSAKGGMVVVMDPANGDLLAAASYPVLASRKATAGLQGIWRNRVFRDCFEPGSVMKIFTMASLLKNSAVDTATVFNCDNDRVPNLYVYNEGGHDYGNLSLMRGFAKSSNVYFGKAAMNLSRDELYRDLTNFGFGQFTSMKFPGEARGILREPGAWSGRSKQTLAIGQEISVTALQVALALCPVANGGDLYAPRYIRKVRNQKGQVVQEVPPVKLRRVMAPSLAAVIRKAMGLVVTEGTGVGTRLDWITIGGKTGTAQKSLDGKTYARGAYVSSFGGMLPLEDPRLVILTVLDEPKGIHHFASESAVPLFKSIVCDIRSSTDWLVDAPGQWMASCPGADPDRLVAVPDVLHLSSVHAADRLASSGFNLAGAEKEGVVIQQVPSPGTRCKPGFTVTLSVASSDPLTRSDQILCPDFQGMSNRQVRSLAARLGIPVKIEGAGYAAAQSLPPRHRLDSGPVTVRMTRPWQ